MTELQFAHIEYSIQTRSIDIFSIGCDGCCEGCCNPEIKDWNLNGHSPEFVIAKVAQLVGSFSKMVDRVFLVGGDPVDAFMHYPNSMYNFVLYLKQEISLPIYLFTRYEYSDIPCGLLENVDYVKTGAYIPALATDNNIQMDIKLATSNQKIIKVR